MMNIASFAKLHNLSSSQRKDCILINEVKRYTFLYDRNEMNHKRSRYRKAAWEEIGRKLGMDGIDCMNRWKIIRDRYRKEKRDGVKGPKSVRIKRWLYYDLCTFLDPYLEDVKPFAQELDELMNQDISAEDSSQDCERSQDSSNEKNPPSEDVTPSLAASSTSFENTSSTSQSATSFSVAPLHSADPASLLPPSTFIRIVMPTDQPPQTVKPGRRKRPKPEPKSYPQKYVKILPKTEPPSNRSRRNGRLEDEDGVDLSMYKDNTPVQDLETVDHLMNFMGNTLKQLSFKKQVKICQELTAVFFNIITHEEEEEED